MKNKSPLRHINTARRCVQIAVILFIFAMPILSLYQSHAAAHAIQWLTGAEQTLFATIDDIALFLFDDPVEALENVKGSVWSARFGSYKVSDPLALVSQVAAEKRLYWPFIVTVIPTVLVALLLGRVFCGWICPAYLLYEMSDKIRRLLHRAGWTPVDLKLSLHTKYAVLAAGVLASSIFGAAVFPLIYPPAIISREWYYRVYHGAFGGGLTLLALSLVLEIAVSRRIVCRYLCPGGALYSLLGKFRVVRLQRKKSACIDCMKCDDVCGLGLQPMTDKTGMECNNCAACIAVCPTDALKFRFGLRDTGPDTREAA